MDHRLSKLPTTQFLFTLFSSLLWWLLSSSRSMIVPLRYGWYSLFSFLMLEFLGMWTSSTRGCERGASMLLVKSVDSCELPFVAADVISSCLRFRVLPPCEFTFDAALGFLFRGGAGDGERFICLVDFLSI